MRPVRTLAALTTVGLVAVGCSESDESGAPDADTEQIDAGLGSEPTDEATESDESQGDQDDSDDAEDGDGSDDGDDTDDPREDQDAEGQAQVAEDVWVMPKSHAEAEELAVAQAEDLQRQVEADGHPQLDEPGVPEDPEDVAVLTAAIATTYYPAVDWNKTQATVRSSFLFSESVMDTPESTQIPERPVTAGDESWASAAECEAEPLVRAEVFEASAEAHVPFHQVMVEYRWVDGADGCDVVQPDYHTLYSVDVMEDPETGEQSVVMLDADRMDLDDDAFESLFDD